MIYIRKDKINFSIYLRYEIDCLIFFFVYCNLLIVIYKVIIELSYCWWCYRVLISVVVRKRSIGIIWDGC